MISLTLSVVLLGFSGSPFCPGKNAPGDVFGVGVGDLPPRPPVAPPAQNLTGKTATVPQAPPKTYAELLSRVEKGEHLTVWVGPGGITDAPAGTKAGLYVCYLEKKNPVWQGPLQVAGTVTTTSKFSSVQSFQQTTQSCPDGNCPLPRRR